MRLFCLYAQRTDFDHEFMEIFSSMEKLNSFVNTNPVKINQICEFELDPT